MLFSNYRELVKAKEAAAYWQIRPLDLDEQGDGPANKAKQANGEGGGGNWRVSVAPSRERELSEVISVPGAGVPSPSYRRTIGYIRAVHPRVAGDGATEPRGTVARVRFPSRSPVRPRLVRCDHEVFCHHDASQTAPETGRCRLRER